MLLRIRYFFSKIPKDIRNILLILLVVSIFLGPLFAYNRLRPKPSQPQDDTSAQEPISLKTFEASKSLKLLRQESLGTSGLWWFASNQDYAYIDYDTLITPNKKYLLKDLSFPLWLQPDSQKNFLVNDIQNAYLVEPEGVFAYPKNLQNVVFAQNKYYALELTQTKVNIYSADSSRLNQNLKLEDSQDKDANSYYQLKVVADLPILVQKQSPVEAIQKNGNSRLFSLKNGKLRDLAFIEDAFSTYFGQNRIFYIEEEIISEYLTSYENSLIEIDPITAISKEKSLRLNNKTWQQGYLGNVLPQRCTEKNQKLYCLVKKNFDTSINFSTPDIIVKYDFEAGEVSYPFNNLRFSASKIIIDDQENYFLVSQESGQIYQITE